MITDVAGWVGTYPFRAIPHSSLLDLRTQAATLNISRFVVSSFEGLFNENNLDAYERWHDALSDMTFIEHWPVVNPAMPGQLRGLERIVDRYRPRGIRLLPNYHGYTLRDGVVDELMAFADEHQLVVQVFAMIADPRWHFMLKVPALDPEQLDHFTSRHFNARIIVSGLQPVTRLADRARQCPHLYLDVSRVRGPVFAMEKLVRDVPVDKLLFGSLWPIQIIEATLWQITWSDLPSHTQSLILNTGFEVLMGAPSRET